MRYYFLIAFCSLLSLTVRAQKVNAIWVDSPLKVDGSVSDWDGMPRLYSSDIKMFYEILNDDENIFMKFRVSDKATMAKFMSAGFKLEFAVKSKPKVKANILFPVFKMPGRQRGQKTRTTNQKPDQMKDYLLSARTAQVEGFLHQQDFIPSIDLAKAPFTYAFGTQDKEHLILELRIPLSEIYADGIPTAKQLKKGIKISAKLLAMERPEGKAGLAMEGMQGGGGGHSGGHGGGGGGMQGGGGMRGGGGPGGGGGRPGGDRPNMQSASGTSSISFKAIMASKEK